MDSPDLSMKVRMFFLCICISARFVESDYRVHRRRLSDLLTGEAPHMLENWNHGRKPPVSIHVARLCAMECPVQWDFAMDILGVLIGSVNNDGRHEALPISSG